MSVRPYVCLSVHQVLGETWFSGPLIKIEVWFLRALLLLDVVILVIIVFETECICLLKDPKSRPQMMNNFVQSIFNIFFISSHICIIAKYIKSSKSLLHHFYLQNKSFLNAIYILYFTDLYCIMNGLVTNNYYICMVY